MLVTSWLLHQLPYSDCQSVPNTSQNSCPSSLADTQWWAPALRNDSSSSPYLPVWFLINSPDSLDSTNPPFRIFSLPKFFTKLPVWLTIGLWVILFCSYTSLLQLLGIIKQCISNLRAETIHSASSDLSVPQLAIDSWSPQSVSLYYYQFFLVADGSDPNFPNCSDSTCSLNPQAALSDSGLKLPFTIIIALIFIAVQQSCRCYYSISQRHSLTRLAHCRSLLTISTEMG